MKKLAALVVVLSATACSQNLKPEEVGHAMPTSAVLQITAPNPGAAAPLLSSPGGALAAMAPAGGPSPLAVVSWEFATAVNGGVLWTLAPITWFTQLVPPTRCDPDACTWGPGSAATDLNSWELVVARKGDGYVYSLSGAPKSTGGTHFVPVLSGQAWPGTLPNRGHGGFGVDFDAAWAGLDHAAGEVQKDFGHLDVSYDARTDLALAVTFLAARDADDPGTDPVNPNRVNAAYSFGADAAGGDLQLGWRTLPAGPTGKTVALQTRWLTGSGGRAEAALTAPGASVSFTQCWDGPPAWGMSFDGSSGAGSESACLFPTAAPPTITIP